MARGYIASAKHAEECGRLFESLRLYKVALGLAPRSVKLQGRIDKLVVQLNNLGTGAADAENVDPGQNREVPHRGGAGGGGAKKTAAAAPAAPAPAAADGDDEPAHAGQPQTPEAPAETGETPLMSEAERRVLAVLNAADVKGLMDLHGIGKKRATLIFAHREAAGPLASLNGLTAWGLTANFVSTFAKQNCI
jgi:DNA uptake protein ComE-like DNA-binding protein